MAQVPSRIQTEQPNTDFEKTLQQALLSYMRILSQVLNKGLDYTDNFNAQEKTYTTNATPDTEDAIAHTLKRVPVRFQVHNSDKAVHLYDSGTPWTTTHIYLKASVASATVKIFIS